ncbi:hypothetical protein Tco_0054330 [Tanacetum coccineum]
MRTRSQSCNSNRQQQQVNPTFVEPFNLVEPIENQTPPIVTMDDNRTMAQILEAPTVGYEDAIVVPEITADNFELSTITSTISSGTLPSNTITNPKVDLKGITTRSGVAYQGPTIPTTSSSLPKVVERETEVTKDTNDECLALAYLGASINLMPLSVWKKFSLPELTPTCMTLELADRSITQPIDIAEDVYYSSEVLGSRCDCDDFLLEEVDAFLALEDDPTSPEVDDSYYDPEGDILLLESFLNDDPSLPPPTQGNYLPEIQKELKVCEAKTDKSPIDEPPEVELKDLPPHLECTFLEGGNKFPVIIAKDLSVEEKAALIKVLKSHKRAIAWKLSDIKGINPKFYTHKILMEEDYKPAIQHQRRVNLKIHDVIKKEVEKLLNAGLIYPISDSPWVSPVHCVTKKGGFTVVEKDENELIPTRLVTG